MVPFIASPGANAFQVSRAVVPNHLLGMPFQSRRTEHAHAVSDHADRGNAVSNHADRGHVVSGHADRGHVSCEERYF